MITKIKTTAKAWVALLSGILVAVSGALPHEWAPWVALTVAVLGAIATWATPNTAPADDA